MSFTEYLEERSFVNGKEQTGKTWKMTGDSYEDAVKKYGKKNVKKGKKDKQGKETVEVLVENIYKKNTPESIVRGYTADALVLIDEGNFSPAERYLKEALQWMKKIKTGK